MFLWHRKKKKAELESVFDQLISDEVKQDVRRKAQENLRRLQSLEVERQLVQRRGNQ